MHAVYTTHELDWDQQMTTATIQTPAKLQAARLPFSCHIIHAKLLTEAKQI
jgi:hypothetical protein